MSRIYYITFKMEGPSAEVLRLTRLLRRITVRRGELCRWLRRYPAMSAGNAKPLAEIFRHCSPKSPAAALKISPMAGRS